MFTNTAVLSAYRGAGRPEAIAIIERAMDMLAAELKLDPAELRRRNLIEGPFPHTTPTGLNYDSGDYARALDLALQTAGYEQLRRDQRARRERKRNAAARHRHLVLRGDDGCALHGRVRDRLRA